MAVLVTGGAGYIGSVAVEQLLAAGEQVVVLDNLCTGHRIAAMPAADFVEGSVLDAALLGEILARYDIDTVMHFAASSLVSESCEHPSKYFENNVVGAQRVLQPLVEYGVRHFILSSTAAIYGNPDSVPVTEEAEAKPLNPYGLSKWMIERMLEWYHRAYGLRYISLRYFNACGATALHGEDHNPETHLVPNVLSAALGRKDAITVFGNDYDTPDGTCIRDYIHVADLADAHLRAMNYLRAQGSSVILNLGTTIGTSVLEVINAVRRVTDRDIHVTHAPRRPGDADRLVASARKAQVTLDWRPSRSDIDTVVRDAYAWRLKYPDGYASQHNGMAART